MADMPEWGPNDPQERRVKRVVAIALGVVCAILIFAVLMTLPRFTSY